MYFFPIRTDPDLINLNLDSQIPKLLNLMNMVRWRVPREAEWKSTWEGPRVS